MTTYKQLTREFNKKVRELRKTCKHPRLTDWLEEQWAIAHPTRYSVKVCKVCDEIVGRKTTCDKCGKVIESVREDINKNPDYNEGTGLDGDRPWSEVFCKDCQKKWDEYKAKYPYKGKKEEEWIYAHGVHSKFMGR